MMIEIWKQRVKQHQKKMMKYSKYIFNDHFVIVCLFLVGAMGYAYSNYLKTIASYDVKGQLIGVLVFTAVLGIGKLATLVQPADAVLEKLIFSWHNFVYSGIKFSLKAPPLFVSRKVFSTDSK